MKVLHHCPTCKKVAETKGELKLGSLTVRTYMCGHVESITGVSSAKEDTLDVTSVDGKRPFKFQIEGGRFLEAANGRALLADEMGIGKTIQSLIFLAAHPECRPFVVFVKAGLRVQWNKEAVRWGDFICQVCDDTHTDLLPGFDGYIISYDSAWRVGFKSVTKIEKVYNKDTGNFDDKKVRVMEPIPGKSLKEQLAKCRVKTAVMDECQLIKNTESKRTKAVQDVCRELDHVIALSGTPIKNNAAEYFPVLNILRPDKFPNKNQFVYGWCDSYSNGYSTKTGGLKEPKKFADFTKDFILRRERKDVLPDLPLIFRQFTFCDLGEVVEDAYKKKMQEFSDFYAEGDGGNSFAFQSNILAYLSEMRHLTGLAKIEPVVEFTEDFVTTTERKLAIFVHHKDVGSTLKQKLENIQRQWPAEWGKGILQLTSDLDAWQRDDVVEKFRSNDYRVCIFSTLASGEGLNLQFCSDAIMMERQWNPANEEQAEARFPRPGSLADKINAIYYVAVGTVDEFFSELVERKREIVSSTMGNRETVKWDQSSLMKELAETLYTKGGKKWGF